MSGSRARGGANAGPPQRRGEHGPVVQRRDPHGHPPGGPGAHPEASHPRARRAAGAAGRAGRRRSTRSSRSAGPICKTRCRSGWARSFRATPPPGRARDPPPGAVPTSSLAELPIGGTAVGTGINTHREFPERMAAALARRRASRFGRRRTRSRAWPSATPRSRPPAPSRRWPSASRASPTTSGLLGSGPALRDRRDPDPRASARQLDHARQGQPGDPRGGHDGCRPGHGQRRHDHLGQRAGLEFRSQRDDAGHRLQPAPIDRLADPPRPTTWPPSASTPSNSSRARKRRGRGRASRPTRSGAGSSSRKAWR